MESKNKARHKYNFSFKLKVTKFAERGNMRQPSSLMLTENVFVNGAKIKKPKRLKLKVNPDYRVLGDQYVKKK